MQFLWTIDAKPSTRYDGPIGELKFCAKSYVDKFLLTEQCISQTFKITLYITFGLISEPSIKSLNSLNVQTGPTSIVL